MYNKKSRAFQTMLKLLSLLTVIYFVVPTPIKANTIIDTTLFERYIEAKQNNISNELPSSLSKGDLYKKLRSAQHQNDTIQIQEWVLASYQTIIRQFPNCQNTIKTSDIHTILRHTNTHYYNQIENSLSFSMQWRENQQQTSLSETCQRLMQCIQNNADSINPQGSKQCTNIVNNTYKIASSFSQQNNRLLHGNQRRETFDNGTLEDSSFDLLLDMQTIGDLLFTINKPTPKIIWYELPKTQDLGLYNNTQNTVTNPSNTTGQQNNTGNQSNSIPKNITQTQLPYYNKLQNKENQTQTNPKEKLENEVQQLINQQATQQIAQWTNGLTLFANNLCQTWIIITGTTITQEQTERENYTNQLEDYIETFDTQEWINNVLLWTGISSWQQNEQTNSGNNATGNNNNNTNTINDLDDDIEQAQQCLQTCNNIYSQEQNTCQQSNGLDQGLCNYTATTNVLICKTKCMCGISPQNTPETMQKLLTYKIRYCMVPSQPSIIASSTKVLSIEAIVDQINAVLIALKDSGQLGKRTHVKEFLETSHQKIKLKNMIVFTISVTFKPIFNSISHQVQSAQQKEKNQQKEQKLLETNNKNKYISLANPDSYTVGQRPIINPPHYHKLLEQLQEIAKLKQERTNQEEKILKRQYESNMDESIGNFLINNNLFREKATTILEDLQSVTESLKTTIEKSK